MDDSDRTCRARTAGIDIGLQQGPASDGRDHCQDVEDLRLQLKLCDERSGRGK